MDNRPPRLAIVGASVRAAAFSAIRGGFEVAAADMFADADLTDLCPATRISDYPEGFAAWLETVACDAWLYTGALENHPELVDRMAATRPLLGNRGGALRKVRDPMVLQEKCGLAGLRFPETTLSANCLPLDGTWLCKTYAGASGSGVWRLDDNRSLERAERERAYFQALAPGEPAAAILLINEHEAEVVGVTLQLIGDDEMHPWRYAGSIGPIELSPARDETLCRLGAILHSEFELRGLIGVDLLLDGEETWIIEVNPRVTASVEVFERAAGRSLIAAHAAASGLGVEAKAARADPLIHGKQIVYAAQTASVLPSFADWTRAQPRWGEFPMVADLPHPGQMIRAGHPIATVFAVGASLEECRHRLDAAADELRSRSFGYT